MSFCQGNLPAALILGHLLFVTGTRTRTGKGPWMRFTEQQLVDCAFGSFAHKVARGAMRLLEALGAIELQKSTQYVRGMPDRARLVRVKMDVLKTWLQRTGESGSSHPAESPDGQVKEIEVSKPASNRSKARVKRVGLPSGVLAAHTRCTNNNTPKSPSAEGDLSSSKTIHSELPTRCKVWTVGDSVPADPHLQAFASHVWCHKVVLALRLTMVTQPEARRMLNAIARGEVLPDQMTYVEYVMSQRTTPWQGGIVALLKHLKAQWKSEDGEYRSGVEKMMQAMQRMSNNFQTAADVRDELREGWACALEEPTPFGDSANAWNEWMAEQAVALTGRN